MYGAVDSGHYGRPGTTSISLSWRGVVVGNGLG